MGTQAQVSLLYVDDDHDAREILCSVLSRKFPGLRLSVAGDGQEGLELFRGNRPDMVVTDISMPRLDGIGMTEAIRELDENVVIIFLTAHNDAPFLMAAARLGVIHYLQKPVDSHKLFGVIGQCLGLIMARGEDSRP